MKSLSVVIPAFNEEALIERSLLLLNEELNTTIEDYEIIVINDGSFDRTPYILKELTSKIIHLKVIDNETNQGLGAALRKGFFSASKALVFYTDADMPIDYGMIHKAIEFLEKTHADLVMGFRGKRFDESLHRLTYSLVYNWLICLLFGIHVKDINFAFKLIRSDVLAGLNLKAKGSFIDAEMVVKATNCGFKIEQFYVKYFPRELGHSHLARFNAIGIILYEIIRYYPEIIKKSKP